MILSNGGLFEDPAPEVFGVGLRSAPDDGIIGLRVGGAGTVRGTSEFNPGDDPFGVGSGSAATVGPDFEPAFSVRGGALPRIAITAAKMITGNAIDAVTAATMGHFEACESVRRRPVLVSIDARSERRATA